MTDGHYHKISIVTPSFNQGIFIEETIQSVLGQNYPNLEYIIIDGGSSDNSVDIIKKYDSQLTFWISEKDHGQTDALNKGFRRCTGDIVAYINSDDVYEPGTLHFVNEFFCQRSEVNMIYGDAEVIDANGKFLFHKKEIRFDRLMGAFIGFGLLVSQPTAFWKRNIFDIAGYFKATLQFDMDGEFWSRIAFIGNIKHVERPMAKIRYHENAKTVSNFRNRNDTAEKEYLNEKLNSFKHYKVAKFIPFSLFTKLGKLYRLKRILIRLFKGHYFKDYKQRI